jgi:hypothetical protein
LRLYPGISLEGLRITTTKLTLDYLKNITETNISPTG